MPGEVCDEAWDVVAAGAQRGDREVNDVEPVEEVLAEPAGGHLDGEIPIRRRDHLNVDGDRPGRPDGRHLALLQRAKELRLEVERHLPDLVEK